MCWPVDDYGPGVLQYFSEPQPVKSSLHLDDTCDNSGCQQAVLQYWWQSDSWQTIAVPTASDCSNGGKMNGPLTLEVQGG